MTTVIKAMADEQKRAQYFFPVSMKLVLTLVAKVIIDEQAETLVESLMGVTHMLENDKHLELKQIYELFCQASSQQSIINLIAIKYHAHIDSKGMQLISQNQSGGPVTFIQNVIFIFISLHY